MSDKKTLFSFFSHLPIRYKLIVIILGITFAALLTAMIVGSIGNYLILRAEKQEQMGIMADFTAKNVASALDFLDQQAAEESLQALAFDSSIAKACVYDSNNHLFASYTADSGKEGNAYKPCDTVHNEKERHNETLNVLWADLPIKSGGNTIGEVELIYDLTGSHIKFFWITVMNLVILLGALLIAYIIANIVQRIISQPVTELANAAHKFAGREDFSIHVEKTTEDELGHMVDAFNRMVQKMKERDQIIVKAREDALSASKMKSEFLANMSHELRTPLNSIIGMTRMIIESDSLDRENRDMGKTVYKSATNLLDIVNDILDISKIEAGSIVLEKIGFDFKDTIAGLVEVMAPLASAKGVSLKYQFKTDDIPYIKGDPLRVNRILTNLVSNAVKYTNAGEVGITVHRNSISEEERKVEALKYDGEKGSVDVVIGTTPVASNKIEIYCEVKDTGIGIPEDKLEAVFEKFTQADVSTTRKFGGTGLGLAITRELVEMMGGKIGVRSKVGVGSTFWFRIPFDVADQLDVQEQKKKEKKKRTPKTVSRIEAGKARILIAEDHLLNQDFIQRLLKRMGFKHCEIQENGKLALEAYREKDYDLVLMDCHMPDKNGYEATREIRKHEKQTGRHTPIIAMTADAMKGTQEKCIEAGMDEYVTKPIDSDELKDVLSQWITFEEDEGEKKQEHQIIQNDKDHDVPASLGILKEYTDTPEEMKELIDVFIQQSDENLSHLEKFVIDGECQEWMEESHKLKGGAGMVGAEKLRDLCAQAQNMINATAKDRNAIFTAIKSEYEQVKAYLLQKVEEY